MSRNVPQGVTLGRASDGGMLSGGSGGYDGDYEGPWPERIIHK